MSGGLKFIAALLVFSSACGSPDPGPGDAGVTGATGTTGTTGSTGATGSTFKLTLGNFDAWCSISVTQPAGTTLPNGPAAGSNVVSFAAGTAVKLHGEPASSSFEWAPSAGHGGWSGAIDSGQNAISKDTTVTMSADKSVSVCCPFPDGTGCP